MRHDTQSLYERLGGEDAILAAVEGLYGRLIGDDVTRPFFESMDMPALVRKQRAFLTHAFDGPEEYKGRSLRAAHSELVRSKGLTDLHFDRVATHLKATLEELGVEESLIGEVMGLVGPTRTEVLGR